MASRVNQAIEAYRELAGMEEVVDGVVARGEEHGGEHGLGCGIGAIGVLS